MIQHLLAGIGVLAVLAVLGIVVVVLLKVAVARGWNPFK